MYIGSNDNSSTQEKNTIINAPQEVKTIQNQKGLILTRAILDTMGNKINDKTIDRFGEDTINRNRDRVIEGYKLNDSMT